ncbi:MAG: peptide deformylase [Candidatus Gottesmanbacteria bacterium]
MRPIVHIPNTVLSKSAKRVTVFDKKLHTIIADMKETLLAAKNPKGVGLAAPQIGVPLQLFLTKPSAKEEIRVFINPDIIHTDSPISTEKKSEHLEGCLSIPNIWGDVNRAPTVTIVYQDEKGQQHKETVTGFLATIIQHETDHINGILFTRRVLEQKNKLYQTGKDENGKEILEEITI